MAFSARFVASIAITLWGVLTFFIGLGNANILWIALGLVLSVVGLPMLASNPWAASRLYPSRGELDGPG
jgi:hypothetical protein